MNLVAKKTNLNIKGSTQEEAFKAFYESMNRLRKYVGDQVTDHNSREIIRLLKDVELENVDQKKLLNDFISGNVDPSKFSKDATYKGLIKSLSKEFGSTELRFENVLVGLCFRSTYTKCVQLRAKIT